MPGDIYDFPVFSSGSPVINQLFASEFAVRNARQRALEQAAAQETARAQIAAQREVAQAQLQSGSQNQQMANMFRMQELKSRDKSEADRNKIFQQQADTDKAYREGLIKKPDTRSQAEVDEMNAASEAIAEQFNAAYQTRLKNATATIEVARKTAIDNVGFFTGGNKAEINAKHDQLLKDSVDTITQEILDISIKNASGAIGFDPLTKTFRAVKLGGGTAATGKPFVAPAGTSDEYDEWGNPKAKPGLGAAAGLGTTPAVVTPVVTPDAANPAALGPTAQAVVGVGQPMLDKVLGSAADMFGVKAPTAPVTAPVTAGTPSVRRLLVDSTGRQTSVLLTPEDDATLQRQLLAVPPEQRPATYKAIIGQLLQSRRAVFPTPQPTDPLDFRSLMN